MLFGTGKRLTKFDKQLDVSYRGQQINNVTEYTYLGNVLDQFMNFNSNFDKVYKRATGRLKLLARLRFYLTTESAFSIFTMMVQPILTYRSTVKLLHTNTQLKKLRSLERRAGVIIGRTVPSIHGCINIESCCLVKKSLERTLCQHFNNYFQINEYGRKTRNSGYLVKLPKVNLELGKHSFSYAGAKMFNDLPLQIRKLETYATFKKELVKHFK